MVVQLKKVRGSFTRCWGYDRGIGQHKIPLVKKIPQRMFNFGANPKNRALTRGADPQMPALGQKIDPVLFMGNRVFSR